MRAWRNFLIRSGLRYQQAYKAGQSQSICTPADVGVPNALSCESMVLSPPSSSIREILDAELRVSFPKVAASLVVSEDVRNDVTGYDLPIWVIPDVKNPFGGGVRDGYRTDDKRLRLSLFIGAFKV